MKCHITPETVGFGLFMSIHREIMKPLDGKYEAKCKIKVGGKESEETFDIWVSNGDINFGQCLAIKGLEKAEVIEVKKI